MGGDSKLKSLRAEVRSFVLFRNTTQRPVDLFWVNYSSRPERYATILPGKHSLIDTYVTHPWVFEDRWSGERMHVAHEPVFHPQPWYRNVNGHGMPVRREVAIHFPVRTLKENCLWRIVSLCADGTESALWELEIPHMLKEQLAARWKNRGPVK